MIDLRDILKTKKVVAIVGASNNPSKYGYKIFKDLLNKGFNVFPVNPHEKTIQGKRCYHTLSELNSAHTIFLVDFVVPPKITLEVLNQVKSLGITHVWFQPGSESPSALEFCKKNDLDFVYNSCMMTESDMLNFKIN